MSTFAPTVHPTRPWSVAVAPLGTILGVWAHPDDEAYLSAGVMAAARRNDQRVAVVHATLGEHGSSDPDRWPPNRLAPVRHVELGRSLRLLGVTERHQLGHADGGCDIVDHRLASDQIATVIEQLRPDTIITFGPDGMTGHPDHRAVSRWTTDAWHATGRSSRLLYATVTTEWVRRHQTLNDEISAFDDGLPHAVEPAVAALTLELDDDLLDQKIAALRAHRSQTRNLEAAIGSAAYRRWWDVESFVEVPR
jgi:LmbE family N-acetylglucosaminyl deacetylase